MLRQQYRCSVVTRCILLAGVKESRKCTSWWSCHLLLELSCAANWLPSDTMQISNPFAGNVVKCSPILIFFTNKLSDKFMVKWQLELGWFTGLKGHWSETSFFNPSVGEGYPLRCISCSVPIILNYACVQQGDDNGGVTWINANYQRPRYCHAPVKILPHSPAPICHWRLSPASLASPEDNSMTHSCMLFIAVHMQVAVINVSLNKKRTIFIYYLLHLKPYWLFTSKNHR